MAGRDPNQTLPVPASGQAAAGMAQGGNGRRLRDRGACLSSTFEEGREKARTRFIEQLVSTTTRPIKPPSDAHLRNGEGIADPSYLLGEIEELRKIAGRAGFGSLEYLLALAEEECREQGKRLTRSAG